MHECLDDQLDNQRVDDGKSASCFFGSRRRRRGKKAASRRNAARRTSSVLRVMRLIHGGRHGVLWPFLIVRLARAPHRVLAFSRV